MTTIDFARRMAALTLLAAVTSELAASTDARQAKRLLAELKQAYPATPFTHVSATPIPGWYEVWMGTNVAYVSVRNVRYFVFGHLFDARTQTDLTAPKLAQAQQTRVADPPALPAGSPDAALSIRSLPLADALTRMRGDGSRTLVLFSDPNCPYCRQLEPELDQLDRVTIHTFIVPFQGRALAQAIWCAPDRAAAWHDAMTRPPATAPDAVPECAHPLERNLALARRWRVVATPTIVFADGTRLEGSADAAELESRLARVSPPPSHPASPATKENHR